MKIISISKALTLVKKTEKKTKYKTCSKYY